MKRSYTGKRTYSIPLIISTAPGILLIILLFFIPVCMILIEAFRDTSGLFSLQNFFDVLTDPYSWRIAWFTFFQALLSTAGALLLGLPGAYLVSHYQFRGKRLVKSVAQLPFVLPSILVVLGFVIFFGNSGILNDMIRKVFSLKEAPLHILYSFKAIILAHTFYNFPICLTLVSSYWEHMSPRQEYAASTLGARPSTVFRTVTLPRLIPPITAAASMIFLFCFTSFSIILVLGGGPQFTTLEVKIYQLARVQFDLHHAAAFALFSLTISTIVLYVYIRSQQLLRSSQQMTGQQIITVKPSKISVSWIALYIFTSIILVAAPLLAIVYRSFQAPIRRSSTTIFTLRWYKELFGITSTNAFFSQSLNAIGSSLLIAGIVTLLAIPFSLSLSTLILHMKRRWRAAAETVLMMPMAISSVIIGLGYVLIASNFTVSNISYILIIGAHLIITLPFMLRALLPAYRTIHDVYTPAAFSLGAAPLKTFLHVELPLLSPALVSGLLFVFAISIGEMNATLLLSDSTIVTIPILLYRLIGSYNFYGACALGTVLMTICIMLFVSTDSLQKRHL